MICPVPSFTGQGARRPWGHTELVCAEVGRLTGAEWPVESLVTKVAETEPMSAKARPARRAIARTGLVTAFRVPQPAQRKVAASSSSTMYARPVGPCSR